MKIASGLELENECEFILLFTLIFSNLKSKIKIKLLINDYSVFS